MLSFAMTGMLRLAQEFRLKHALKFWKHLYRLISIARGEKKRVKSPEGTLTVTENCKPSALTRCGKDLGIASELWDARWVRDFKKQYCERIACADMRTEKRKVIWKKKGVSLEYPYKISTIEPPTDPRM